MSKMVYIKQIYTNVYVPKACIFIRRTQQGWEYVQSLWNGNGREWPVCKIISATILQD